MTVHAARKEAHAILDRAGIVSTAIKARTVDFSDLARCSRVFVAVSLPTADGHRLTAPFDFAKWRATRDEANRAGFYIELAQSYENTNGDLIVN